MKCILTVLGKDKPGIIAKVSGLLSQYNVNIEDISQTIMQQTFTMIMLVDLSTSNVSMLDLSNEMKKLSEEIGVSIHLQNKELFDCMHRV